MAFAGKAAAHIRKGDQEHDRQQAHGLQGAALTVCLFCLDLKRQVKEKMMWQAGTRTHTAASNRRGAPQSCERQSAGAP